MKIIDVVQGSPEWIAARIGLPTASSFDRIIQPKKLQPSTAQDGYIARLCAEWFLGQSLDESIGQYAERGKELEESAVARYEFDTGAEAVKIGFCLSDDGRCGCSPDRLVGEDGLLEIKCPGVEAHMGYLLDDRQLARDYVCQTQSQLWITGKKWDDLYSFHGMLPPVRIRLVRDGEYMEALDAVVPEFLARLDEAKATLAPLRAARLEALAEAEAAAEEMTVAEGGVVF